MYVVLEPLETMVICKHFGIKSGEQFHQELCKAAVSILGNIPDLYNFFEVEWKNDESAVTLRIEPRFLINLYDAINKGIDEDEASLGMFKLIGVQLGLTKNILGGLSFITDDWRLDLSELTREDIRIDKGEDYDGTRTYVNSTDNYKVDSIPNYNYSDFHLKTDDAPSKFGDVTGDYYDLFCIDDDMIELEGHLRMADKRDPNTKPTIYQALCNPNITTEELFGIMMMIIRKDMYCGSTNSTLYGEDCAHKLLQVVENIATDARNEKRALTVKEQDIIRHCVDFCIQYSVSDYHLYIEREAKDDFPAGLTVEYLEYHMHCLRLFHPSVFQMNIKQKIVDSKEVISEITFEGADVYIAGMRFQYTAHIVTENHLIIMQPVKED